MASKTATIRRIEVNDRFLVRRVVAAVARSIDATICRIEVADPAR
jgi:hypothetical protein